MGIKAERIQKDIETLAQFTSTPGSGVTRLPFTPEDRKAREYIKQQMLDAGLKVREDGVGTVIGRLEATAIAGRAETGGCVGMEENGTFVVPSIMLGSHYDSVRNGGAFDGIAGLAAAIQTARVLHSEAVKLECPVEVLAMNDEEGTRFGTGMMSSRAIVGELPEEELDTAEDENDTTVRQAMKNFGFEPDLTKAARNRKEIKAFLELHIEQGPLLESNGKEIGIVESIVGLAVYKIIIKGRAGHAGTTPMHLRADALLAASAAISSINSAAFEINRDMVATVGKLHVLPNAANVIPGMVEFTVDARSADAADIEQIRNRINAILKQLKADFGVSTQLFNIFYCKPVSLSKKIIDILIRETTALGYSYRLMNSGAGHDSMVMADYTDTGMIFVPSKNGISHTPEEWTDYEDLKKGAEVLLNTVIRLGTEK